MKKIIKILVLFIFISIPIIAHCALTTDIVGYWKLDGNSNDATASDDDGTDTSITYSNANGIINNGAGFNGSSGKITLSASGFPTGNSARSVNLWFKPGTVSGSRQLFLYGTATTGRKFGIARAGNRILVVCYGFNANVASNSSLSAGTMYMVTVTFDGSGNIKYYLNGSTAGTATLATINTTADNGEIGHGWDGYFNGSIDEVGIWDRELTSTEVTDLYNSGDGLQYPFTTATRRIINIE